MVAEERKHTSQVHVGFIGEMADNLQLRSPSRKAVQKKRKLRGKLYGIHLGYGEEARKLLKEFEDIKERLGFQNLRETAAWMLSKTRPLFVTDDEEESTSTRTQQPG